MVCRDCFFVADRVETYKRPLAWKDFTRFHERPAAPRAQGNERFTVSKLERQLFQQEFPWLREGEFNCIRRGGGGGGGGYRAPRAGAGDGDELEGSDIEDPGGLDEPLVEVDDGESDVGEPLPEMEVDSELARLREEFADENPDYAYFYKRVIGDHWALENLGMVSDDAGAMRERAWQSIDAFFTNSRVVCALITQYTPSMALTCWRQSFACVAISSLSFG